MEDEEYEKDDDDDEEGKDKNDNGNGPTEMAEASLQNYFNLNPRELQRLYDLNILGDRFDGESGQVLMEGEDLIDVDDDAIWSYALLPAAFNEVYLGDLTSRDMPSVGEEVTIDNNREGSYDDDAQRVGGFLDSIQELLDDWDSDDEDKEMGGDSRDEEVEED